jgi:peptidyl-prolyl cis-trans isomerase C
MKPPVLLLLFALIFLETGCRPARQEPDSEALVRVGQNVLRVDDVRTEWQRRRSRGEAPEPRVILADLIQRQVLLERARQLGLDNDPEVARAWENALIAKLKDRELAPRLRAASVSEAELQAAVGTSPGTVAPRPGDVRVAVLRQELTSKTSAARRQQLRERLEQIKLDELPARGFGVLAANLSDDQPSRFQGGDLGWHSENLETSSLDPAVLEAASRLRLPGELSPVIEGRDAFYRIRLIDRRSEVQPSKKSTLALARHRALQQKRADLEREFQESVTAAVPVMPLRELDPSEITSALSTAAVPDPIPANP